MRALGAFWCFRLRSLPILDSDGKNAEPTVYFLTLFGALIYIGVVIYQKKTSGTTYRPFLLSFLIRISVYYANFVIFREVDSTITTRWPNKLEVNRP